jgi:galactose mutarotase-like enzyme
MSIQKSVFGVIDSQQVEAFEIESGTVHATIITYAAALSRLFVPDGKGGQVDIALGYDDLASYVQNRGSAGAICGRYANRIADARFTLDGQTYSLSANEPPNHIHGGLGGFSKRVWTGEPDTANRAVRLTLNRPDGDEGYPGAVTATVTYTLTDDPALEIVMEATTDRPTVVNMAYHGYWNLAGHGSGHVRDQHLLIDADHYTPVGPGKIPTGELASVAGTAFDFRSPPSSRKPATTIISASTTMGSLCAVRRVRWTRSHAEDWRSGPTSRAFSSTRPIISGRRRPSAKAALPMRSMPGSHSRRRTFRMRRTSHTSPQRCCARARRTAM